VKFHVDDHELGALTFDGELNYAMIRKLEKNVESQTKIHPIDIFANRSHVTATEIAQLILEKFEVAEVVESAPAEATERGDAGFGSTGV
jgi:phosphoribulokinase